MTLNDIACSSCIVKIKKDIKKKQGVEKVSIISGSGNLQINYDESVINKEEIHHLINKMSLRMFD